MSGRARRAADERGSIFMIVLFAIVAILFLGTLVIDVGHWFSEKRDLQNRADAGALAAGTAYGALLSTCTYDAGETVPQPENQSIVTVARNYAGEAFNLDSKDRELVFQVNTTEYGQPDGADGWPCLNRYGPDGELLPYYTDVAAYEDDPGGFFAGLMDVFVERIAAGARVEIQQAEVFKSALPFGVPDVNPKLAKAIIVNECTGATLAEATLTKTGPIAGTDLVGWGTTTAVQPTGNVPDPSGTCGSFTPGGASTDNGGSIGVRILLSGGANTQCGQPLVECYDAGSANGLWHVRTWQGDPLGGPQYTPGNWTSGNPTSSYLPVLRGVTLTSGGCVPAAQFTTAAAGCTFGVRADVDFGDQADPQSFPLSGQGVTAEVRANGTLLTAPGPGSTIWTGNVQAQAEGPNPITITWSWQQRRNGVTWRGLACAVGQNQNPCKVLNQTFGAAGRAFVASLERSGPIKQVDVRDATSLTPIESIQSGRPWPAFNVGVAIEATDTLTVATSVDSPLVKFRAFKDNNNSPSQSQALDCDPGISNFRQEIEQGCAGEFKINDGTSPPWNPCPDPSVFGMARPWQCINVATGASMGQFGQGLAARLGNVNSCENPNHWEDFPNFEADDPRIVNLFVVPYGTFATPGQNPVPIILYGTFYITGYGSTASDDRCRTVTGKADPAEKGQLVGHFIKYAILDAKPNGKACDPDPASLIPCVPVLVR